jgi:hypothetical protein
LEQKTPAQPVSGGKGVVIMQSRLNIAATIVGEAVVPIVLTVILGVIFYGLTLFQPHYPGFQIIVGAVISSLFFLTLRINRRDAFAVLLVLFVIQMGLILRPPSLFRFGTSSLFIVAYASSVYIFYQAFYLKTVGLRYLHPLVLAAIYAIFSLLVSTILILAGKIYQSVEPIRLLYGIETNALNSFVIGLGTGLGIFVLDNGIIKRIRTTLNTAWTALKGAFQQFERNLLLLSRNTVFRGEPYPALRHRTL